MAKGFPRETPVDSRRRSRSSSPDKERRHRHAASRGLGGSSRRACAAAHSSKEAAPDDRSASPSSRASSSSSSLPRSASFASSRGAGQRTDSASVDSRLWEHGSDATATDLTTDYSEATDATERSWSPSVERAPKRRRLADDRAEASSSHGKAAAAASRVTAKVRNQASSRPRRGPRAPETSRGSGGKATDRKKRGVGGVPKRRSQPVARIDATDAASAIAGPSSTGKRRSRRASEKPSLEDGKGRRGRRRLPAASTSGASESSAAGSLPESSVSVRKRKAPGGDKASRTGGDGLTTSAASRGVRESEAKQGSTRSRKSRSRMTITGGHSARRLKAI